MAEAASVCDIPWPLLDGWLVSQRPVCFVIAPGYWLAYQRFLGLLTPCGVTVELDHITHATLDSGPACRRAGGSVSPDSKGDMEDESISSLNAL